VLLEEFLSGRGAHDYVLQLLCANCRRDVRSGVSDTR
jgi:hypothetical protein